MSNSITLSEIERESKEFFVVLKDIEKILEDYRNKEMTEEHILNKVEQWNRTYQKLIRSIVKRKKEIVLIQ
jgi:hypothetical protein